MAKQDQSHNLSRTELTQLIAKYWVLVLTVFLSGTIAMHLVLNVFYTDIYETTTRLLVKVGRENLETPTTVQNGQLLSQGVRLADINSEVQILSSRELVDRVVDRLGPDTFKSVLALPATWQGYPKYYLKLAARRVKNAYRDTLIALGLDKRLTPRETAIVAVADAVKVEPIRDSDILILRVRMPSQKLCLDVANVLLDEYMRRRALARQSPAGVKFFEARLREVRDTLSDLQKSRFGIRSRWNLSAPEEQRSLYLKELNTLETELMQNSAEMERLNRQRELMAKRMEDLPELTQKEQTELSNPSIQSLKERITALRMERSKTASRYQPSSEVLQKMDTEIADLESALRTENATILNSVVSESNPIRRQFGANVEEDNVRSAGLEMRNKYLQEPAAALSQRVHDIDRGLDMVESTEREYRRAEQDYLTYAKRYEEARLSEELDALRVANVSVVESPEPPIKPVYPNKLFLVGIAMPVSLLFGIALCALLETTEDRLTDEKSVVALTGLAYLGKVDLREMAASTKEHGNGHGRKMLSEL
jgi:uncharacterized protein involved in exopolysaccharide biosynthesis